MDHTIKSFIKEKNETVSTVAYKLQLSRPTFDTYIAIYEQNLPLPKKIYQRIFDSLFSDYNIAPDVFKERLDIYELILIEGVNIDNIDFFSRRVDRVSRLMSRIRGNINYEELDEELYIFIDLLIKHYSDDMLYQVVQYFLRLYGKKDMTQITELQIAFSSELFHTFNKLNQNEIAFRYSDWNSYTQVCQRAQIREKLGRVQLEKERLIKEENKLRRQLYGNKIWGLDI